MDKSSPNYIFAHAILSNDTDTVLIAAALFEKLAEESLKELWVAFGQSGSADGYLSIS